jgi:hypothetical protein
MSELKEMTDRFAVMMAATYPQGHRFAGRRVYEVDGKYQREVMALAVEIEQAKEAEAAKPQINEGQLAWLNRLQGATDKSGQRLYQNGSDYKRKLDKLRERAFNGEDLTAEQGSVAQNFEKQGANFGPEFAPPTTQQRLVASEQKTGGFGPPNHIHGGVGTIATHINKGETP